MYYYLILSQDEFLENQVIEELFRERMTYLINENKPIDFWIVMSPTFLQKEHLKNRIISTQFFEQNDQLFVKNKCYCTMILSTSIHYINWLKLRLGYFEQFQESFIQSKNPYKSNGLFGLLEENTIENQNFFLSEKPILHPTIRLKELKNLIESRT
jgi:hypothetical protein